MPYICVNIAQTLTNDQKAVLADALSQGVTAFHGKPRPEVCMVNIEDGKSLFFGAKPLDGAYVDVRVCGSFSFEEKDAYTRHATAVLADQLGIANTAVYVTTTDFDNWGVFGTQRLPH